MPARAPALSRIPDVINGVKPLRRAVLVLATVIVAAPMAAFAQDAAPGRISTVTRLVKIFSDLENGLATAVQSGNAAAVDKMLQDDFELRVASMPGNPTP